MEKANPQIENGYTRIANEILEALAKTPLNGTQRRIIDVVFRYTYGFQRKDSELSVSFLLNALGMTNSQSKQVRRELEFLIKNKILMEVRKPTKNSSRCLSFNKRYKEWTVYTIGLNRPEVELDHSREDNLDHSPEVELDQSPVVGLDHQEIYLKDIKEIKESCRQHKTPEATYEENIGILSPHTAERIQKLLEDGITEELLSKYITVAVERNIKTWSYIEKMALGNLESNIKTLSEYESYLIEWENSKKKNNSTKKAEIPQYKNYQQREYPEDVYESYYVDVTK